MDETEIRNPFINDRSARIAKHAVELLGPPDRMLYRSKSLGKPTTIFNANIYNSGAEKIWYGDLEIERDRKALIELSARVGPVYILWEMDGRFLEKMPAIGYVRSRAIVVVEGSDITYSAEFDARVKALTERASRASCKTIAKKKGAKAE